VIKIMLIVAGCLGIALGISGYLLKNALEDKATAVAQLDEAANANLSLTEGLVRLTAEKERLGKVQSRNRRARDDLSRKNEALKRDIAGVAKDSAADACVNQPIPADLRMLLDKANPRAGGDPAVRSGRAVRPDA